MSPAFTGDQFPIQGSEIAVYLLGLVSSPATIVGFRLRAGHFSAAW
jgi:hypothetical protein